MARHLFMYTLGNVDWDQNGCAFDDADALAKAAGYRLLDAYLAQAQAPSFTARSPDA